MSLNEQSAPTIAATAAAAAVVQKIFVSISWLQQTSESASH